VVAADGSLLISVDEQKLIWRVSYEYRPSGAKWSSPAALGNFRHVAPILRVMLQELFRVSFASGAACGA